MELSVDKLVSEKRLSQKFLDTFLFTVMCHVEGRRGDG